jgi:hypothetical protein
MKKRRTLGAAAMLAVMAGSCAAQTRINLRTQAQSVDFSQATATRPNRTGTILPATCQTGETFYKIDDEPGKNLYGCTSTNAWTRLGNPANLDAGVGVAILGSTTVAADDAVIPYYSTGTGAPSHPCRTGQEFYTDTESGLLYYCRQPNVWQSVGEGGGGTPAVQAPITSTGGVIGCPTCVVNTGSYANPAWLASLDAGKVSSGTLAAERLPEAAARTDQSNTYGAGLKQVFQASGTNAGMRVTAGALPTAAAAGDVAVDSGDGNTLKWYNGTEWRAAGGSSGGSFDYDPSTTIFQVEEFLSGGTASERIGAWGWLASNCTSCVSPNNAGVYGSFRLATGTTAGTTTSIYSLGTTQSAVQAAGMFDLRLRVKPGQVDADTTVRLGLNCSTSNTPANGQPTDGIYAEILAGETTVNGVARAGGAETRTASLATAAAGSWHTVRIRRVDAATVGFSANGSVERTLNTNVPGGGCNIFLNVGNGAAAASKTLEVDYVWLKVTGLAR